MEDERLADPPDGRGELPLERMLDGAARLGHEYFLIDNESVQRLRTRGGPSVVTTALDRDRLERQHHVLGVHERPACPRHSGRLVPDNLLVKGLGS